MNIAIVQWFRALPFISSQVSGDRYTSPIHLIQFLSFLLNDENPTQQICIKIRSDPLEKQYFIKCLSKIIDIAMDSQKKQKKIQMIKQIQKLSIQSSQALKIFFKKEEDFKLRQQMFGRIQQFEQQNLQLNQKLQNNIKINKQLQQEISKKNGLLQEYQIKLKYFDQRGYHDMIENMQNRIKQLQSQKFSIIIQKQKIQKTLHILQDNSQTDKYKLRLEIQQKQNFIKKLQKQSQQNILLQKIKHLQQLLTYQRKSKNNQAQDLKAKDKQIKQLKDYKLNQSIQIKKLQIQIDKKTQEIKDLQIEIRNKSNPSQYPQSLPSILYELPENQYQELVCMKEDCIKIRQDSSTWMTKCEEMIKIIQNYKDQIALLTKSQQTIEQQALDHKNIKYYEGIIHQKNSNIDDLREKVKSLKKELQNIRQQKEGQTSGLAKQKRKQQNIIAQLKKQANQHKRQTEQESMIMMGVISQLFQKIR